MGAPGELRRFLALILTIGCVFLFYMFWNQPTTPTSVPMQSFASPELPKVAIASKTDLRWTWSCKNKRCVRKEATPGIPHVSLTTCSMLCGSSHLWPQPTGPMNLGTHAISFTLDQMSFETSVKDPAHAYIQYSLASFNSNILALMDTPSSFSKHIPEDIQKFLIKVSITNSDEIRLKLKTDESYKLTLRLDQKTLLANIQAPNFFGARHGLETLSQLIWWDKFTNSLKILRRASIQDSPRFPYRGLMIDTARNFMPLESLKKVIVGMAANKLNTFHWHVSDSQSFSMELPSVPQLAKYGAYGPDQIYTVDQVKDLVEFGRLHGIRTIIEVDVPAHVGNGWTWGPEEGLGDLVVCVNVQPWSLYCGEPPCGQLNPDNPKVFDVLEKIYKDIIELTGEDEIFHIGGDEVNLECWSQFRNRSSSSNPYIDLIDVWGNFTVEAMKRVTAANGGKRPKHMVIWSSNLTKRPYLGKYLNRTEVVVQSWGGSDWTETPELVTSGYSIIVSHVDAWYLDCGYGRWRENGGAACDPYRPWQTVYNHHPWSGDSMYRKSVVGGEACLWTEQVDHMSLDTRLWPRAAAFAERMWSDPLDDHPSGMSPSGSGSTVEDVYSRIITQRERLIRRGLKNEALWPQWCSQNPGMCL